MLGAGQPTTAFRFQAVTRGFFILRIVQAGFSDLLSPKFIVYRGINPWG
jgi:hypothetical protein